MFGRVKQVSRNVGPSLARSREAHFNCPNRRACSRANRVRAVTACRAMIDFIRDRSEIGYEIFDQV